MRPTCRVQKSVGELAPLRVTQLQVSMLDEEVGDSRQGPCRMVTTRPSGRGSLHRVGHSCWGAWLPYCRLNLQLKGNITHLEAQDTLLPAHCTS